MKARHIFYALSLGALLLGAAPVQMASPRPVMVGGIADLDACSSQGQPHNLNPRGDNFLTVRAAPTTNSARYVLVVAG